MGSAHSARSTCSSCLWLSAAGPDGPGLLDELESEVAPGLDPFVVMFGEPGADESDQHSPVRSGKMPTISVRRLISRLRRSWGIVGPDLPPEAPGKRREGEDVGPGSFQVVRYLCSFWAGRPGHGRTEHARMLHRAGRRPSAACLDPRPGRLQHSADTLCQLSHVGQR
jgi:hypothetical protein